MIQHIKFGQNPSFGSRDRVQTSFFFGQNLTSKVLVWPWKWGQGHQKLRFFFFPMSQWCLCASLVKIHQLVQAIRVQTRLIFTVFLVWWPWKLDQGHQNLTDSFNYSNDTIHTFGQNPSFGSRDRVQTSFFWSKFDIQSAGVTLKMRSRSPKSNHFFPMSQCCLFASLVKIH